MKNLAMTFIGATIFIICSCKKDESTSKPVASIKMISSEIVEGDSVRLAVANSREDCDYYWYITSFTSDYSGNYSYSYSGSGYDERCLTGLTCAVYIPSDTKKYYEVTLIASNKQGFDTAMMTIKKNIICNISGKVTAPNGYKLRSCKLYANSESQYNLIKTLDFEENRNAETFNFSVNMYDFLETNSQKDMTIYAVVEYLYDYTIYRSTISADINNLSSSNHVLNFDL